MDSYLIKYWLLEYTKLVRNLTDWIIADKWVTLWIIKLLTGEDSIEYFK